MDVTGWTALDGLYSIAGWPSTRALGGGRSGCPSCDEAVVRIARTPRGIWLDLRGAATIVGDAGGNS